MAHDMMPPRRPVLTPDLLLRAYAAGVFPMSDSRDAPDVFWVDPRMRGIIPLGGFHISRSLRRHIMRSNDLHPMHLLKPHRWAAPGEIVRNTRTILCHMIRVIPNMPREI